MTDKFFLAALCPVTTLTDNSEIPDRNILFSFPDQIPSFSNLSVLLLANERFSETATCELKAAADLTEEPAPMVP
jgi:hypothetical protein